MSRIQSPTEYYKIVVHRNGKHGTERGTTANLEEGQALVHVAFAGVSWSDLRTMSMNQQNGQTYPIVPGSEYSGVILGDTNSSGTSHKAWKVAGLRPLGCNDCPACRTGDHHWCSDRNRYKPDGAFSGILSLPNYEGHRLPLNMSLKHGASVGLVARCMDGLDRLVVTSGQSACIVGAGPIGNLCAQILRKKGVYVTVVDAQARWLAHLFKYDVDTLLKLGELQQFDYLIETSGDDSQLQELIGQVKSGAKLLLLGCPYSKPAYHIIAEANDQHGIHSSRPKPSEGAWQKAIKSIQSGAICLDEHTTMVQPMETYEKAWESIAAAEYMRVLLSFNPTLESL